MDYLYITIKTIVISEKVKIPLLLLLVDFSLSASNPGARKGFNGSFNIGPCFVKGNITSYEKQRNTQFGMHKKNRLFCQQNSTTGNYMFGGKLPYANLFALVG